MAYKKVLPKLGPKTPPKLPPKFYYRALLHSRPTGVIAQELTWIKIEKKPPEFLKIEILNGDPTPLQCHASRGTGKLGSDRVCWVNKDVREHVIQFLNGLWPFLPAQNLNNDEKIVVPALAGTQWFVMDKTGAGSGLPVTFDYGIDVPPTPPGPGIIGED